MLRFWASGIRGRLATAISLTALIPLIGAVLLARDAIRQSTERFAAPEIAQRLDQSLELYGELAATVKEQMRASATAIARRPDLLRALTTRDVAASQRALEASLQEHPELLRVTVRDDNDVKVAEVEREQAADPATQHELFVQRELSPSAVAKHAPGDEDEEEVGSAPAPGTYSLQAVFTTPRARFEGLEEMSAFVDFYKKITSRKEHDDSAFLQAFALLLGLTMVAAIFVGNFVARGVVARLRSVAEATARVGAGDLSIRVPETGSDELSELARAFNRMVTEVETSRGRIEYLQRIAAWQGMARRLAHEIKNPLTPIQLAVQEVHRRYSGQDQQYKQLLDASIDIVEAEVGTLRRLVNEFSGFARLPQAELAPADLFEFLREQRHQLAVHEGDLAALLVGKEDQASLAHIRVDFKIPEGRAPVRIDEQMLRRALLNLMRNGVEAITESPSPERRGQIRVSVERGERQHCLRVEDDGPGIDESLWETLFDPYVTTKREGTGLGLAIVKKIVMEHHGEIEVSRSRLGGACFRVLLPACA